MSHVCRFDIPVPLPDFHGCLCKCLFRHQSCFASTSGIPSHQMAEGFHTFVEVQVTNSTNWALRFVGQFFLHVFDYLLMCQSERLGHSVLIEHCYGRFLPVFSNTGKRNYFELCCSQMEWHYLAMANALHQVQTNRMRRQKGGYNQDGKQMINTALDLRLECMMPIYKVLKHCNSAESWVEISNFILFSMQCCKFTDAEMSR
jgi:hypothetical protein